MRKIKGQLKDELHSGRDRASGYRLALAIVSICLLMPLLIILVVALGLGLGGGGGSIALGWSMVAACGTIIAVNAYFNVSLAGKHSAGTDGDTSDHTKNKPGKSL